MIIFILACSDANPSSSAIPILAKKEEKKK
jgi:hypothetical protein